MNSCCHRKTKLRVVNNSFINNKSINKKHVENMFEKWHVFWEREGRGRLINPLFWPENNLLISPGEGVIIGTRDYSTCHWRHVQDGPQQKTTSLRSPIRRKGSPYVLWVHRDAPSRWTTGILQAWPWRQDGISSRQFHAQFHNLRAVPTSARFQTADRILRICEGSATYPLTTIAVALCIHVRNSKNEEVSSWVEKIFRYFYVRCMLSVFSASHYWHKTAVGV